MRLFCLVEDICRGNFCYDLGFLFRCILLLGPDGNNALVVAVVVDRGPILSTVVITLLVWRSWVMEPPEPVDKLFIRNFFGVVLDLNDLSMACLA